MVASDRQPCLLHPGCEILWKFTTGKLKIGTTDRETGEMLQLQG